MENELVFDLDTVAEYLVEKCGCTAEDADSFFCKESSTGDTLFYDFSEKFRTDALDCDSILKQDHLSHL